MQGTLLDERTSQQLDRSIRLLADNSSLPLADINQYPDLDKAYIQVRSIASLLYENGEYSALVKLLEQARPTNLTLITGTVGSFLFGCLKTGSIPQECTPDCIGSLPGCATATPCKDQVWILCNDQLQQLSPGTTSMAIVYATCLSSDQLNQLAKAGVTSYALATMTKQGYQLGPVQTIQQLKSPESVNMAQATSTQQTAQPTELLVVPNPNNNAAGWLLLLIIIIIIILVVWWYNKNKSQRLY